MHYVIVKHTCYFWRNARRLLGTQDESHANVDKEAEDRDDENEDDDASDGSMNLEHLIPVKRKKVSKPDELVGSLAGCPSAVSVSLAPAPTCQPSLNLASIASLGQGYYCIRFLSF